MKTLKPIILSFLIVSLSFASRAQKNQKLLDSLNQIISDPNSADTTIAHTYLRLTEVLYVSNLDTIVPLCTKTKEIAEKGLASDPSPIEKRSFQNALGQAINNIGYYHENHGNIEEALKLYDQSLNIQEQIGDKKGMGYSLNNIAFIYYHQGNISEAITYHKRSLAIREEIQHLHGISQSLNNLGIIYKAQGNIPISLEYYHKSLKIREQIGDLQGVGTSLNNLGNTYQEQGNYEDAMTYYKKALDIRKEIGHKRGISHSYSSIGTLSLKLGDTLTSLNHHKMALKIREEIDDKRGISGSLTHLGFINQKQGKLDSALYYYKRALQIRIEIKQSLGQSANHNDIARTYLAMDKINEAKTHADSSLLIAETIGNAIRIREASETLTIIHKKLGEYEKALKMYEMYILYYDSVRNEQNQKQAIRQQTQYEFEKAQLVKEQEEKEAARVLQQQTTRRNNLQYSLIFLGILLFFGLILGLGFIKVSPTVAEGLIFFAFLIFFEFLLVLADPFVNQYTGGEPIYNLLANALLAGAIFPVHAFFEKTLKRRLLK